MRSTRTGKSARKGRSKGKPQLSLGLLRGQGGPGRGQGRKKRKHGYVPHTRRPFLDRHHPVHVSLKIEPGLPSLRGRLLWKAVRRGFLFGRVFGKTRDSPEIFRIIHFSVQGAHIHLICEANDRRALSRGIQGFEIRVAKAINRALGGRTGAVFADRYHERIVSSPTQCRHALAYVLLNGRRHAAAEGATYPRDRVDPFSSASWFDGWTVESPRAWGIRAGPAESDEPLVAAPQSWLLKGGWKRGGGLISPDFVPGLPQKAPPLPEW